MDNLENKKEILPLEPNRQIQLVVNHAGEDEGTIDLGNVFRNMKLKRRIFAWVLVLCLLVGVCAPLLLYQFTKPMLTVSSVVTLRYEVPIKERNSKGELVVPDNPEYEPVEDLTAPDGEKLDLNQITSSYVLQTALKGMKLSKPVTASALSRNINIQTILTEASQRAKEALAGLADAKNAEAYNQLRNTEMKYQNRFIVTLTNGFGDEDSRSKTVLTDAEMKLLLNRILSAFNGYLVDTYADIKLPDDVFSEIDVEELDIPDSVDQLRSGIQNLYDYCDGKSDTLKEYRSWKTGRNLLDWMETLNTFKSINIDYLYALVNGNAVTKDKTALLTSWKYTLRTAKSDLDTVNETITETKKILDNYKNDEVLIYQQESDAARTTKAATEYYNNLILQQTENYEKAAKLKATILDYEDRIQRLEAATGSAVSQELEEELARSVSGAQGLYQSVRSHMEELFESQMFKTYIDYSAAQGKLPSFLAASAKKMIIGGVVGAVVALGLWFLAALAPEFSKNKKVENKGKEAEAK